MNKKIDINKAKCTKLSFGAAVNFATDDSGGLKGFSIDAYTGAVVERWWGKLAIAVDGITSKQRMPIFRNHDRGEIVGYSTKTQKDTSFRVDGVFSQKTAVAREVMDLAGEGFPWQASIGVNPKLIMEIRENSSMIVNGKELIGPAEVWLESEVSETSFVPLGADGETSITVFSEEENPNKGANGVSKTQNERSHMDLAKLDLAKLKADRPDLVKSITDQAVTQLDNEALQTATEAGAKTERERIQSVSAQSFPGFEDIVNEAMFDGKSLAGDVAIKINAANLKAQAKAATDLSADAPNAVDESLDNGDLSTSNSGPLTEEKAKVNWAKDANLRRDFMEFEDYFAYAKALVDPKVNIQVQGGVK